MQTNQGKGETTESRPTLSRVALGCRRQPVFTPRPLHDPMADMAIVLYDPSVDDKPDPEEAAAELARANAKKEEEDRGPHKSLKQILGLDQIEKKKVAKVPVVIDPRLTKVLRPHQIEGVKVSRLDIVVGAS